MELPAEHQSRGDDGCLNRHALNDLLSGRGRRMTKTAFAEKMDVARTTVSKWLAGHWSPDFHTTQKMAEILSVDIGELWSEDAPLRVDQDFYDQRLRELIADQPEHVKARILSMVAEELASRGPEESDEDDQPKEKK